MEEGLNVTKSVGGDVSVPMAMTRECADDMEGESGSYRSVCGGVPVCHGLKQSIAMVPTDADAM